MRFCKFNIFTVSALALTLALCVGCGKSDGLTPISGTVTLDGQPLATGSIDFAPTGGADGTSSGAMIVDGKYEARVSPTQLVVNIHSQQEVEKEDATQEEIERGLTKIPQEIVPDKYNKSSELKIDVTGSERKFDFDLKTGE